MFYFTCNQSKIYESFTFWNNFKGSTAQHRTLNLQHSCLFNEIIAFWSLIVTFSHIAILVFSVSKFKTSCNHKTMFLNVKLQRLCKSHHLQCITSKDSEKLEKSLCVRDKVEDLCWMPVVFGPSDDCITHRHDSVIDITKWAQEYFQKRLSVNNPPCHLQMPTTALSCKKEAICFEVEKCSISIWHSF